MNKTKDEHLYFCWTQTICIFLYRYQDTMLGSTLCTKVMMRWCIEDWRAGDLEFLIKKWSVKGYHSQPPSLRSHHQLQLCGGGVGGLLCRATIPYPPPCDHIIISFVVDGVNGLLLMGCHFQPLKSLTPSWSWLIMPSGNKVYNLRCYCLYYFPPEFSVTWCGIFVFYIYRIVFSQNNV